MTLPTPHGDKLEALLRNEKLPSGDRRVVKRAIKRYKAWIKAMMRIPTGTSCVDRATELLNEYRLFLDLDVVFDSHDDFLYRQKGQLKLDNTVIEEFLPLLVTRRVPRACRKLLGWSSFMLCGPLFHVYHTHRDWLARCSCAEEGSRFHHFEATVLAGLIRLRPLGRG